MKKNNSNTRPNNTKSKDLKQIPERYLKIITPLVDQALATLAKGDPLSASIAIGSLDSNGKHIVSIDLTKFTNEQDAGRALQLVSRQMNADFAFMILETWTLQPDYYHKYREIYDQYGSIEASPFAVPAISMILDTYYGEWISLEPTIQTDGTKKIIDSSFPQFISNGSDGVFNTMLPWKDVARVLR